MCKPQYGNQDFYQLTLVLHMCFGRFLLAFKSRDLSQADKSIKRVFSFPNWVMSSKSSFSVSQAWGLNFLKTKFCQSSQIYLSPEKTEKTVYFLSLETFEWWIEQNNFAKVPNSFFGYNCNLSFKNWSLGKKTLL